MPAIAFAPTTSAPIAGAAYNHHMFGHALAMLRSKGAISIAEFQKSMHLTAPQAEAIIGDFARKGLISNGFSVSGMLDAVKPNWYPNATNATSTKMSQTIENKSEQVKNTLNKLTEISDDENVSEAEDDHAEA